MNERPYPHGHQPSLFSSVRNPVKFWSLNGVDPWWQSARHSTCSSLAKSFSGTTARILLATSHSGGDGDKSPCLTGATFSKGGWATPPGGSPQTTTAGPVFSGGQRRCDSSHEVSTSPKTAAEEVATDARSLVATRGDDCWRAEDVLGLQRRDWPTRESTQSICSDMTCIAC